MSARAIFTLLVVLWAISSKAQQAGIRTGGVTLYPTLGLSVGYDDNVALSPGDGIDSMFYSIAPALRLQAGDERSALLLEGGLEYTEYEASSFDDYLDYYVSAGWDYRPTVRHGLAVDARYARGHDRRGEGIREFIPGTVQRDVDEHTTRELDASYGYGASGAKGYLELNAGITDFSYRNNRDLTLIGDYTADRLGAAFRWRVAPKTAMLLLARWADYDFDFSERDNDQRFYGLGLTWEATAKTTGRAEFGYQTREFVATGVEYNGTAWEAAVEWRPKEYSAFEFSTARETDHAFGQSLFLVRRRQEIAWQHQWRSRIGSVVDYSWADEELEPGGRNDDILAYGASINYQMRRWLLLGLGYKHFERDSSDPIFDYERNELILSAELAF